MQTADFTIADVLAWARTKPADGRYDYQSPQQCALCHFLRETGRAAAPTVDMWSENYPGRWSDGFYGFSNTYPREMEPALSGDGSFQGDEALWTFGGLVDRLERLCPETVVTRSDWQAIDAYLTDIEDVARERVSA